MTFDVAELVKSYCYEPRYPGLSTYWEECLSDWIIDDLAELLQWRKELSNI